MHIYIACSDSEINMEPRFRQGTSNLIAAQVEQARQRATGRLLSVKEFIPIRRKSYAWTITEGTVVLPTFQSLLTLSSSGSAR